MITPPPELVQQWVTEVWHEGTPARLSLSDMHIAAEAAQWGADQELEACCDTLQRHAHWDLAVFELMDDRRPKPPSLKEQALLAIDTAVADGRMSPDVSYTIRRALEALDD